MPSTFMGLSIGTSGLYTYQAALNTTTHNISNVETKGYTRQEALRQAGEALRSYTSYGMIGTGVNCTGVEQIRNQYYDTKYWKANTTYGEYSMKNYYMQQFDAIFYETEDSTSGFTSVFNKLSAAIDTLANDGTSASNRTYMVNVAKQFTEYFNSAAQSLANIQSDANDEIRSYADRINSIGQDIFTLNQQINVIELAGGTASELRDQRALLIDELSEIVPVEIEEYKILANDGSATGATSYNVYICGQKLVDYVSCEKLVCVAREERLNTSDVDGLYDLRWENGLRFNITGASVSGKLNSLFQVRDGNNNNPFSGKVQTAAANAAGGVTVTINSSTYAKSGQISLNQQGTIKLGNKEFTYDGYETVKNADGTFSFALNITSGTVAELNNYIGRDAQAGNNIDYCGIPYYMAQLDEFVREFAEAVNSVLITGEDANGDAGRILFTGTSATGKEYDFAVSGEVTDVSADGKTIEIKADAGEDSVPDENGGYIYINHTKYEYSGYTYDNATGTYTYTMVDEVPAEAVNEKADNYSLNRDSDTDNYNRITASNFTVCDAIIKNVDLLATTTDNEQDADAGNIMDKIYELMNDKDVLEFRGAAASEFITCIVSDIAVDAEKVKTFERSYYDVCQTIINQRLSQSGVDSDEEASNLIRFQNAYNLSAKAISIMTEIYDKLILDTGV